MRLGVGLCGPLRFSIALMTFYEDETVPVPLPSVLIMLGMEVDV